ncbi:MAG: biotin/lipoyl-containing protein [Terracidiphilus sp.]
MKLQVGIDGKTYEVEVEVLEDDASPRHPSYAPSHALPDAARSTPVSGTKAAVPAAEESAGEDKLCRSPVTGVVIKVNVEPGQLIQANAPIMVLEAMKMETNVTAQSAGKVKSVRVAQGDSVKVNQVIVEFE